MRRIIQIVAIAFLLLLGTATLSLYSMYQKSVASLETSQKSEQAVTDQYAQTISAVAEIQDSLDTILPEGQKLPAYNPSYANERAMGGPNSHEILDRIAMIRAGLQRGKERIEKLEADLKHSGLRLDGLQKMVAGLRHSLKEKEDQLAEMGTQLAQVQDTLRVHDETLAERQQELATVYFVEGPKRELMKSGVIEARGGLLGIGKTLRPSARIPEPLFSMINTDEESVVRLNAAKAQVVSAQPLTSYELRLVDGKLELHILDPAEFRKVRQLVIVTA
jgi:hypothetical protein